MLFYLYYLFNRWHRPVIHHGVILRRPLLQRHHLLVASTTCSTRFTVSIIVKCGPLLITASSG